jgi:hypothetical protein
MENEKDLGTSLIETVGKSDLAQFIPDYLEIGLDSQLTEGVLKELPVVSTSLAIYKATLGIRDFILLKKIILFLKEASKVDEQERQEFLSKIAEDKKYQRRVGEQLLLYIDRLDDIEKAIFLAKLFNGYVKREIEYDTFQRLSNAVDKTFIGDLRNLKQYYSTDLKKVGKDILHHLAQSGLVSMESHMILDSDGIIFNQNKLGETFIKLVLS